MNKLVKIAMDRPWGYEPAPIGHIDTQPGKSMLTADNQTGRWRPMYDDGLTRSPSLKQPRGLLNGRQHQFDYQGWRHDAPMRNFRDTQMDYQGWRHGIDKLQENPTNTPQLPDYQRPAKSTQPATSDSRKPHVWQWEEFNRDHYQGANDEEVEELRTMHNERQRRLMLEEARRRIRERGTGARGVTRPQQRPLGGINQPTYGYDEMPNYDGADRNLRGWLDQLRGGYSDTPRYNGPGRDDLRGWSDPHDRMYRPPRYRGWWDREGDWRKRAVERRIAQPFGRVEDKRF